MTNHTQNGPVLNLEAHIARQDLREAKQAKQAAMTLLVETKPDAAKAAASRPYFNMINDRERTARNRLIAATAGAN